MQHRPPVLATLPIATRASKTAQQMEATIHFSCSFETCVLPAFWPRSRLRCSFRANGFIKNMALGWRGTLLLAMLTAPHCTVRLQDACCFIPCCARRFGQVRGRAALTRLTFSSHTSRVTAGLHLGPRAAVARRDRQCRAHGLPKYDPVTNEWVVLAFLELGVGRRRRPQRGDARPGRPA